MYNRKDGYYKKAKKEGYSSRAAFKLKEINSKYKLIKKGDTVLDAGCAPGGWLEVLSEIVTDNGKVVGVDLLDVKNIRAKNVVFIKGDLKDANTAERILPFQPFDTVVSDAAPNTTGQKIVDHVNSIELARTVFEIAKKFLKQGGNFLFKLFDGEDRDELLHDLKKYFCSIKIVRPDATRKNSFEIYIICKGFKNDK